MEPLFQAADNTHANKGREAMTDKHTNAPAHVPGQAEKPQTGTDTGTDKRVIENPASTGGEGAREGDNTTKPNTPQSDDGRKMGYGEQPQRR